MPSGDVTMGNDLGFSFQHGLQKLNNGNIVTLDNGNLSEEFLGSSTPLTRAIEISIDDNGELIKGKLGKDLKTEDAYNAAYRFSLNEIEIDLIKKAHYYKHNHQQTKHVVESFAAGDDSEGSF